MNLDVLSTDTVQNISSEYKRLVVFMPICTLFLICRIHYHWLYKLFFFPYLISRDGENFILWLWHF